MPRFVFRFDRITCTTCGQVSQVVRRGAHRGRNQHVYEPMPAQCMACALKEADATARDYLRRRWRQLFEEAGRPVWELPPELRLDGDPGRPVPLSPLPPPADYVPCVPFVAGNNTPSWARPVKVLPPAMSVPPCPNVLFCSHDLSLSGAPRILGNVIPHLQGMQKRLYAQREGPLREFVDSQRIEFTSGFDLEWADVLVANTLLSARHVLLASQAGKPSVWWIHEWEPNSCGNVAEVREAIKQATSVVFAHSAQAENYASLRPEGVSVIRSTIPPVPARDRGQARRELGLSEDDYVVLTMGQDEPRKGQADLRAAARRQPWKVLYCHGQRDPWTYYAAADVYVCTSRQECYPIAVQEARAYGLPIVSTEIPACVEMIHHDVSGYLYRPGEFTMLRHFLQVLRRDADLRQRMGSVPLIGPTWPDTVAAYQRSILDVLINRSAEQPHVVYHIAGLGANWQGIVTEQLSQLADARIKHVFCTHVGTGLDWCVDEARRHGIEMVVAEHRDNVQHFERPAMELIERLARGSDRPILYVHTKGVSHPLAAVLYHEWRRLIMDHLVGQWPAHIQALRDYECVGVNWWSSEGKEHFSGNMWLARAEWIRKLPDFACYYRDRFSCERWIGSMPGCRAKSLLCENAAFWDRDRELLHRLRNGSVAPQEAT